jgi:hypothetical protein
MLLMTIACWAYAFAVVFMRARAIVLERERETEWVGHLAGRVAAPSDANVALGVEAAIAPQFGARA